MYHQVGPLEDAIVDDDEGRGHFVHVSWSDHLDPIIQRTFAGENYYQNRLTAANKAKQEAEDSLHKLKFDWVSERHKIKQEVLLEVSIVLDKEEGTDSVDEEAWADVGLI